MARDIRDDERMAEWASVAPDYRSRWEAKYGTTGRWEDFEPAYRYGYKMACDPRELGFDLHPGPASVPRRVRHMGHALRLSVRRKCLGSAEAKHS